jgi:hypothetical protein
MGVELYNIKEFNLDGVVTLISEVGLTNWKMNTKTELKSLDWNESPTMTVLAKCPCHHLINPAIALLNQN